MTHSVQSRALMSDANLSPNMSTLIPKIQCKMWNFHAPFNSDKKQNDNLSTKTSNTRQNSLINDHLSAC